MKNSFIKILSIILLVIVITTFMPTTTNASWISDIFKSANNFIKDRQDNLPLTVDKDIISGIYNILLIIGIISAVIVGIILGIQFIIGSVEQKSKIKESLLPYIAGCIVLFGAFGIWKLIIEILR